MGAIIKEKDGHRLIRPFNSWDMNYHLHDENGNDYLIDIGDVQDNQNDYEEYGCFLWEEFKELEDIELIKESAWRVNKVSQKDLYAIDGWDFLSKI